MITVDSAHFPLLKRGHSSQMNVRKPYRGSIVMTCGAEDCMGNVNKNHAFVSRYDAAKEWAEERGLKPGINVKIN